MEKKRIILYKMHGMTVRMDLGYFSDEPLLIALDSIARKMNIDVHSIIVFTLGTQEEMKKGRKYFCPHCGCFTKGGYLEKTHSCEECENC